MAVDPVVIKFAVGGVAEVDRAFDSILKRIERTEVGALRASERSARERTRAAHDEETARIKGTERRAKEEERIERQKDREFERLARQVSQEEKRARQESLRDFERTEEYKLAVRRRSAEAAGRYAEQEAMAERRARERAGRGLGSVAKNIGGTLGGMASMAGTALSIGGGFALADIAGNQMQAEKAAALLMNSATSGGRAPAGYDTRRILSEAGQVSKETGVDKTELIGAVQNYVAKAGADKFGSAMQNMGFFAQLSKATGTGLSDITGAAGILQAQNKNLGTKDVQQMLLDIMEQGKQGAVEISDLASLAGGLGSTRGLYQGSQTENQRKLLAMAQVTRTEGTSAEEAMVAVKDLGSEAVAKAQSKEAPAWLKQAVDSRTGLIKGGPEQLIMSALTGTGGNLGKLEAVFGQRGVRAFQRLAPIYNQAGGGAAGIQAVQSEMNPLLNARGSQAQLQQQFAQVMQTPSERLHQAWEKLVVTTGDKLEPVLSKLADKMPEIIDKLSGVIEAGGKLAEWFLDNPIYGIGAVILAATTKDIVAAGIGNAIKAVLMESVTSTMASQGVGGKLGAGALGVVGAVGAAAVVGSLMNTTGEDKTDKAIAGHDIAALSSRKKELEEKVAQGPAGDLGSVPGLGKALNAVLPEDDFFKSLKKQLSDTTAELKKLQAAASSAAAATGDASRHSPIDHRTGGGS